MLTLHMIVRQEQQRFAKSYEASEPVLASASVGLRHRIHPVTETRIRFGRGLVRIGLYLAKTDTLGVDLLQLRRRSGATLAHGRP